MVFTDIINHSYLLEVSVDSHFERAECISLFSTFWASMHKFEEVSVISTFGEISIFYCTTLLILDEFYYMIFTWILLDFWRSTLFCPGMAFSQAYLMHLFILKYGLHQFLVYWNIYLCGFWANICAGSIRGIEYACYVYVLITEVTE